MVVYIIVAICFILDLINPGILWYIDAWKYDGDKPTPTRAYMVVNRIIAGTGLIVLAVLWMNHS